MVLKVSRVHFPGLATVKKKTLFFSYFSSVENVDWINFFAFWILMNSNNIISDKL